MTLLDSAMANAALGRIEFTREVVTIDMHVGFMRPASGRRRAAVLQARGISHGDRVAILAPNGDAIVITMLACWWLGAIACPMNVRWSQPELRHAVSDCGASLLVADAVFSATAVELADIVAVTNTDTLAAEARTHVPLEDLRIGGDALAAILYTGGTTGRSKGVMLSHLNFWSASMTRGAELNNAPDSVSLLVAPLFHVAGLGRLVGQTIVGGTCITLPQFRADMVLDAIERHAISDIIVVPTMLQALLDAPGFSPAHVRSLTRIAFGAAPMAPDQLDRALAAWPQAEFFQAYGLTETAGAVCINLPVNHRPEAVAPGLLRSVGRVGLGAEIRIVDERGGDCPRGEVGELVVRGPMVTRSYWNLPEVSAQALRKGWFHTGDGARMDADGYLFIVDRLKDMIITGGENVYSAEVEAAVFEALVAWCRTQLASYKCPRSLQAIDKLPLSAAGKVLKTTLRADHASRRAVRTAEVGD